MLTVSLLPGKLITSCVTGIAHRRPQGESYDQAIRNDATGLWQCPFCQQDNFPELSEVTNSTTFSGCCFFFAVNFLYRFMGVSNPFHLSLESGVQGRW